MAIKGLKVVASSNTSMLLKSLGGYSLFFFRQKKKNIEAETEDYANDNVKKGKLCNLKLTK